MSPARQPRGWAARGMIAVLTVVAGCSSIPPAAPSGRGVEPLTLSKVPEGLTIAGLAEFPADGAAPEAVPFSLDVYTITSSHEQGGLTVPEGADVAIFQRTVKSPPDPAGRTPIKEFGPAGIHGYRDLTPAGDEQLIASRALSEDALRRLTDLSRVDRSRWLQTYGRFVAREESSSVPGVGSLPMPASLVGHAISYTGSSGGPPQEEFQRSVVIGTYPGSSAALAVLDWWYGKHDDKAAPVEAHLYTTPAFQQIGDGGGPVPEAHLVASSDHGAVVLVRTTGIDPVQEDEVRRSIQVARPEDWQKLAASHRSSAARQPKVIATSPDASRPWQLTIEKQGSGSGSVLCLELSAASTGCVTVDDDGPSLNEQVGAVGTVKSTEKTRKNEMYVFGLIAPDTSSVLAGAPDSSGSAATLVKASTGQSIFVASLTKPGPLVRLEVTGSAGTHEQTIPVNG